MKDIPIDDGSDKPLGYVTEDGEMEVRDFVDKQGIARRGYCETELGQHQRWLRQAPDLYEKYQALLSVARLGAAQEPRLGQDAVWTLRCESEHGKGVLVLTADEAQKLVRYHASLQAVGAGPQPQERRRIEASLAVELLHELGDLETWQVDDPLSPFVGEKVVSLEAVQAMLAAVEDLPDPATPEEATPAAPLDPSRCAVCGWPLDPEGKMCVRGNCSQRPLPERFYDPERAKEEYGRAFDGAWARNAAPAAPQRQETT